MGGKDSGSPEERTKTMPVTHQSLPRMAPEGKATRRAQMCMQSTLNRQVSYSSSVKLLAEGTPLVTVAKEVSTHCQKRIGAFASVDYTSGLRLKTHCTE